MTKPDFYTNNRKSLAKIFPDGFIILASNKLLQYSADTTYPFRQDSNFLYLSGINLPDLVMSIDTKTDIATIYLPNLNDYQKRWDGEVDTDFIKKTSGIGNFKNIDELKLDIKKSINKGRKFGCIYPYSEFVEPYGFYANPARRLLFRLLKEYVEERKLIDIRLELARLRSVKQSIEIKYIQDVIDATGKTLDFIKKNLSEYRNEADIMRDLSSGFYKNGADGHGFEPIIASGRNAAVIHYRNNNADINTSDLLLMDVGAQSKFYSADISRTWSLSTPTSRQVDIYKGVIEIQQYAFSLLKPGIYLKDFQNSVEIKAKKVMTKLKCSNANLPYPHGISHFLGLDVHDAGDYQSPLQENMIITVEPGIYLTDEGIGVRIEDDVLITKNGFSNLSKNISNQL